MVRVLCEIKFEDRKRDKDFIQKLDMNEAMDKLVMVLQQLLLVSACVEDGVYLYLEKGITV